MTDARARTSASDPIGVGWVRAGDANWRLGLTFAPGKKQAGAMSGAWDRDLATDLRRLRDAHQVDDLWCLLEEWELQELGIGELDGVAREYGINLRRLPIPDGGIPPDEAALRRAVVEILARLEEGACVVVHCKGGLGRSGTVAGCVLVQAGVAADDALIALEGARGPQCPETAEQRRYIWDFSPSPGAG